MTNILSHSGNKVYLGHFQGNAIKNHMELALEMSAVPRKVSPDISVIMAFTDKNQAIAAKQLEMSGTPYINPCTDIEEEWSNTHKIKYFIEALEQAATPYSLLMDAYDVIFFRDLDEEFIAKFNSFNKMALYNATKNNYPKFDIDYVPDRESLGEFKYLNAGLVIGHTSYLLDLYKEIYSLTQKKTIINPWNSEQMYVRIAANGKQEIGFDYECALFQTFAKTQVTSCGQTCIVI